MLQHICYGCMTVTDQEICPHCGWSVFQNNQNHHLGVGTLLKDTFLVGRVLGQGGFGITYIGMDVKQKKLVAIKEYYPSYLVTRDRRTSNNICLLKAEYQKDFISSSERFLQEGTLYARFRNVPEIVAIHSLFSDNNTSYIILEYIRGMELRDYVQSKGGKLSAEETFAILSPVFRALDAVHKAGLIHRDVTPDNIMLLPGGRVKLLDFGAAHEICDPDPNAQIDHSTTAIVKHGFAPPEQYKARGNLGPWTDEYGLSATFYYCLHGTVPPDAMDRMLGGVELNWSVGGLSQHQQQVLQKAMSLQAADRFGNLERFHLELSRSVPDTAEFISTKQNDEHPESTEKEDTELPKSRQKAPSNTIIATAAAILALFLLLIPMVKDIPFTHQKPSSPPQIPIVETETPNNPTQTSQDDYPAIEQNCSTMWDKGEYGDVLDQLRHQVQMHPDDPRYADLLAHYETTLCVIICSEARAHADDGRYIYAIRTIDNAFRKYAVTDLLIAAGDYRKEFGIQNTSYIAAGKNNSLMIWDNGSVSATGDDEYEELESEHWVDITAVSAGDRHIVGLRSNGTVVSAGSNDCMQREVDSWTNVVAISAGDVHTVALLADGNVVSAGYSWAPRCDTAALLDQAGEKRIVSVAAGYLHTLALLEDGTVIAVGENGNHQCNVDSWTDIAAIYTGTDYSVGLKTDGTVVVAGLTQPDCRTWTNIINIGAGDYFFVGITEQGTVLSAGVEREIGPNTAKVVLQWEDIVHICAGNNHIVAINKSGKILCAGKNDMSQLNIEGVYVTYPRKLPVG